MHLLLASVLTILMIAGCSGTPAPPYRPVADVKTLMSAVMEPSAEVYWDAVGVIVDDTGEHAFQPETDEDWDAVRSAAYVVAESGNLLMMPTRAQDDGAWVQAAQQMTEAAQKAIRAAETRDVDAVFDTGAEVYDACTSCHSQYSPQIVRPNAR